MKIQLIAREGFRLIVPSLVLFIVLLAGRFFVLSVPVLCFVLFCVFFFRNPERTAADAQPGDLISPADGTVIDISEVIEEEFMGGSAIRIAIFMSPADVHVNRAPCQGLVASMKRKPGKFALAFRKDVDMGNERNFILFAGEDEKVLIVQIAGFLARRIVPYVKAGQRVERGEAVGIIAFGSRVDIYFPKYYEPMVQLREKVKAGTTVVARKSKGVQ